MSSMKSPPVLEEDTNYEMYKKEVDLWEILVGEDLSAEQKGPALVKAIKVTKAREKVFLVTSELLLDRIIHFVPVYVSCVFVMVLV